MAGVDQPRNAKHMQELYPALSMGQCEVLFTSGISNTKLKELNDKNKKICEERVEGFIPASGFVEDPLKIVNVVLLGKTGAGKSQTGNMILGEKKLEASSAAVSQTKVTALGECMIGGTLVRVMDTPGSFDTDAKAEDVATEIMKIGTAFKEGVHVFVFIKSLGNPRYTQEERQAFQCIEEMFSDSALCHCILLYTYAHLILGMDDAKDKTIKGYVESSLGSNGADAEEIKKIHSSIGNRVITVENVTSTPFERKVQRYRLVSFFQAMLAKAEPKAYTHEVFEAAKAAYQERVRADNDPDVAETVSKYMNNKSHKEMKKFLKGDVKKGVREVIADNPKLADKDKKIKTAIEAKAEVLTNKEYLDKVQDMAIAFFGAAGTLLSKFATTILPHVLAFLAKKYLKV